MSKTNSYIFPVFRAELIKLRRSPVWYILALCILLTAIGVFVAHLMDAHNMVRLNYDPWQRYFRASTAIFNLFISVPYVVLLVSAVVFIEQRASAWKYLYTLPKTRGQLYFSKLTMILFLYLFSIVMLVLGLVLSGYVLDFFRPEYEFNYYSPDFSELGKQFGHFFIGSLGLMAWQYWLSLQFKNILVPLGLGVLGFVFALIMSVTGQTLTLYIPYAIPMIVQDLDMFRSEYITDSFIPGLKNVELYSLLYFLIFSLLGYWIERRRNVKQ